MSEAVNKKILEGLVVSDKSSKTLVVKVVRKFKDQTYSKFMSTSKKFHVHDEKEEGKAGDKVLIIESRPFSKLKKWQLLKIQK
jgi:small subunit ribosomal protein S17